MTINLNEDLQSLTDAFHSGQLSQSEYRNRRKQMLENLENLDSSDNSSSSKRTGPIVVRTIVGTVFMLVLLGLTVVAVKYIW